MFVLQECSICFDDFGPDRYPHCVPCGHIFCNPCLESLLSFSTTARCPNCRIRYASNSIRKLICPLQDPRDAQKFGESDEEALVWEAIRSAVESPEERDQRKAFVEHNSVKAVMAAGMSANLLVALCVMNLLVQVEERNGALEDELRTARVVEQSLCDRIATLQAQPIGAGTSPNPNTDGTHNLMLFMTDLRKIQSAIETIGRDTAKVARHFGEEHEPSALPRASNETSRPNRPLPASTQETSSSGTPANMTQSLSQARASSFRFGISNSRQPVPSPRNSPVQPGSARRRPPPLNLSNSISHQNATDFRSNISVMVGEARSTSDQLAVPQDSGTANYPLLHTALLPTLTPLNIPHIQPPSETTRLSSTSPDRPEPPSRFTSNAPTRGRPPPRAFRPLQLRASASRSRTLTVLRDYTAQASNELSLKRGEKLYLLTNSDTSREWIWCKGENGTTGYASKQYVQIDSA